MQKCFPKVPKIFFVSPNPQKNIYCPTEKYIRTYFGMGSDIFLEGNIIQVSFGLAFRSQRRAIWSYGYTKQS